jgi:hypothetical protein
MSLSQRAVIAQVSIGNLTVEGYITKILLRYPIAVDFKDGLFSYRWVGKDKLDLDLDGYHPGDDSIVTIDKDGLFLSEDVISYEPLTYSKPIKITSLKWWSGLYKIVRRFEYDDDWYNRLERFIDSNHEGLQGLFIEHSFWKSPEHFIAINRSNETTFIKPSKPKSKKGHMYAVQLDGFIKVGFSTNVRSRINSYKTSSKVVDLICIETATIEQELEYHRKHNKGSEKYETTLRNEIHESIRSHLRKIQSSCGN